MTEATSPVPQKKTPWYLRRSVVILGLLAVGPLALPFLLYSPDFKRSAKIAITLITVALTAISFVFAPILLNQLIQRLAQMQSVAGV